MSKRKKVFAGPTDFLQSSRYVRKNPILYGIHNVSMKEEYGTFTSVNTPNFRKLSKGKLPQNPHSATLFQEYHDPNARYVERNIYFPDGSEDIIFINPKMKPQNGFLMCPYLDRSLTDDLNNTVRLKIKSKKVDLAVMGGEMRQTANFLDKRVGDVIRGLNKRAFGRTIARVIGSGKWTKGSAPGAITKKKDIRFLDEPRNSPQRRDSFKVTKVPYKLDIVTKKWVKNPYYTDSQHIRIVDDLASSWLEYSYAFKPLLNDVYGAAEAIANVPYAVPVMVAKATMKVERDFLIKQLAGIQDAQWEAEGFHSVRRTLGIRYSRDNPLSAFAALGLTNPASLAWELVTLSFVIDWFIPIGRTLDSLDATVGCQFLGGFNVYDEQVRARPRLYHDTSAYFADFTIWYVRNSYTRSVLTDWPGIPMPSFRWPGSLSQAASGVALLSQLFKR